MQVFILSRREELIFLAANYLDLNYVRRRRAFSNDTVSRRKQVRQHVHLALQIKETYQNFSQTSGMDGI
jgi:hypothetical protein